MAKQENDNRGFFRRLIEDKLRLKVRPDTYTGLNGISSESEDLTVKQLSDEYINGTSLIDATTLNDFVTLSQNRNNKYLGFEEMLEDPIIAAAIEMYADDATPYNDEGNVIWAEGDDETIVTAANRLISVLGLNEKAWRHIYSLCVYGDLYLRLYREGDESDYTSMYSNNNSYAQLTVKPADTQRHLDEYVEFVDNPACLFDLQNKDKTTGFIRIADTTQIKLESVFSTQPLQTVKISDTVMYDNKAFIHIALSESISRNPELLKVDDEINNTSKVYKIKSGKSVLEDAYPVTQSLKLLEDSLLLNRLTKSAIVRLLQIEVGDMPKTEVTNLMHRFKNNLEQKMAIDKRTGLSKSFNSPGPVDNIVYSVTKDGKGAVTVQNLGGDVNVKDIMDLDYFNNKKLAALKIPKQFLNFDSPEGIGGNGVSLTKISSRYAHTIKRIQNAYIQGITNLINYFFLDKNLDYVNMFKIKMVSPSTVEDGEKSEIISNNISQINDIMSLIDILPDDKKLEILSSLFTSKLNMTDISQIIDDFLEKNQPQLEDENNMDYDSDFRGGDFGGNDFGGNDFGGGPDMEFNDTEMELNEPTSEPEETTMTPEA